MCVFGNVQSKYIDLAFVFKLCGLWAFYLNITYQSSVNNFVLLSLDHTDMQIKYYISLQMLFAVRSYDEFSE